MSALEVIACGTGASVQDLGRTGFRRFGVSTAGAMDRHALARANALVGNAPGTAAVELTLAGARFRVQAAPLLVATAGPGVKLEIDGRRIPADTSVRAESGTTLTVGPARGGVYGYLAVAGGIRTAPDLGSRALHLRSGIGGRPLAPGTVLPCVPAGPDTPSRRLPPAAPPDPGPIRVVPGPQEDAFTADGLATFLSAAYTVHPKSDRMGLRLTGPSPAHAAGYNIVSDGIVPGSVQVPGDGQPIVLMRDCQTTGGYPKIATVISADLDRLAQLSPGASLRFAAVTPEKAIAAARAAAQAIAALSANARPLPPLDDTGHLLSHNLIGGVVDGSGEAP